MTAFCLSAVTFAALAPCPWKQAAGDIDSPTLVAYRFTPGDLAQLRDKYHQLPVPPLIGGILRGEDPHVRKLQAGAPGVFHWLDGQNTFLTVNPKHMSVDEVVQANRDGKLNQLKGTTGLALVSWYVHPTLRESCPGSCKIADAEQGGGRYKASILDLGPRDLPYLKSLKAGTLSHLNKKFGVDESRDDIQLLFHFPYEPKHATLHLQVRVNRPKPDVVEAAKCYAIDDIIAYLEAGKTVQDLILDRQRAVGGTFFFSPEARTILETLGSQPIREMRNPYLPH